MNIFDFNGQTALIVGARPKLCRGYAEALRNRGAVVELNCADDEAGRDPTSLSSEKQAGQGGDLSQSLVGAGDVDRYFDDLIDRVRTLDILIVDLDTELSQPLSACSTELFEKTIAEQMTSTFLLLRRALGHMSDNGYGRVITTISGAGAFGMAGTGACNAAHAGVWAMTKTAALEHLGEDLRVNAIAPFADTALISTVQGYRPMLDAGLFEIDPIVSLVCWLSHRNCSVSGEAFSAIGGRFARIWAATGYGHFDPDMPPEGVEENLPRILEADGIIPSSAIDEFTLVSS